MRPGEGLILFAQAWTDIASECLRSQGWDFARHGAPKGPAKEIAQVETGAFFFAVAVLTGEGGSVKKSVITNEWIDGELRPFNVSFAQLDSQAKIGTRRRVDATVKRNVTVLISYGLLAETMSNVFALTEAGKTVFKRLWSER